jgi:dTDP-4-amino-4,6-dideoxygalactose transaminase
MTQAIPFNRPYLTGKEFDYIAQAIEGGWVSGDGPYTKQCNELLEQALGVPKAMLTTSCTHALEMAAFLLDIEPGDEVIVPSYAFVTTANAFVVRGARPVFCDVRPDTINLDEERVEALITPQTKAIVPIHYAGVGCEMDGILEIAERHGVAVVEDNAHGLFGKYRGRHLGTMGALATQSFHETKNVTCGEGGALLINDSGLIKRAEIVLQKGTDRNQYYRGEVDKYTWVDLGSSYVPSDILAAFLYAQLEGRDDIAVRRARIWDRYAEALGDWAGSEGVRLPVVPSHCEQSHHMFYMLLPSLEYRQALIERLKTQDILSVFHYQPLHLSRMGQHFGGRVGDCPVAEDVSDRLLRLPFYNDLSAADQQRVIDAVAAFPGA